MLRVETDEGGVYEAHLRKSDGSEAEVHINKAFAVTSVDSNAAGEHGRGGHRHHLDTAALAKALGVSDAKVQAALEKVRPDKRDNDKTHAKRAAAIAKALGRPTAAVQAVLDAADTDHDGNGSDHHKGGADHATERAALAKALADKFHISTAKAQAALDQTHENHGGRGELAAKLAKQLGIATDKVTKALEQQHQNDD